MFAIINNKTGGILSASNTESLEIQKKNVLACGYDEDIIECKKITYDEYLNLLNKTIVQKPSEIELSKQDTEKLKSEIVVIKEALDFLLGK